MKDGVSPRARWHQNAARCDKQWDATEIGNGAGPGAAPAPAPARAHGRRGAFLYPPTHADAAAEHWRETEASLPPLRNSLMRFAAPIASLEGVHVSVERPSLSPWAGWTTSRRAGGHAPGRLVATTHVGTKRAGHAPATCMQYVHQLCESMNSIEVRDVTKVLDPFGR